MSKKAEQIEAEIEALKVKLKAVRAAERAEKEQELLRLARAVGIDQLLTSMRQRAGSVARKSKPENPKGEPGS